MADSAPYLHDGRAATLIDAINLHGGEAEFAVKEFKSLELSDRMQLISFPPFAAGSLVGPGIAVYVPRRAPIPLDVLPRAKYEAVFAAIGFEPIADLGQSGRIDALGHEQDAAAIDGWKLGEPCVDFSDRRVCRLRI